MLQNILWNGAKETSHSRHYVWDASFAILCSCIGRQFPRNGSERQKENVPVLRSFSKMIIMIHCIFKVKPLLNWSNGKERKRNTKISGQNEFVTQLKTLNMTIIKAKRSTYKYNTSEAPFCFLHICTTLPYRQYTFGLHVHCVCVFKTTLSLKYAQRFHLHYMLATFLLFITWECP
jgi:hypothetical protein